MEENEQPTEESAVETQELPDSQEPELELTGPREYAYKVDGVEGKIEEAKLKKFLDIPEDQELPENLANYAIRAYQKDVAASNRMNTSAQLQKEVRQLVELAQNTPEQFLSHLGIDFELLALQRAKQLIDENRMDPKDREMLQFKREKEAWENQRRQEEEYQMAMQAQEDARAEGQYLYNKAKQVSESIGIPYTPVVNDMFRNAMRQGLEMGKVLDPEDVAPYVKQEYNQLISEAGKRMSPEQMVAVFGEEVVSKLKSAAVARIKDPLKQTNPIVPQSTPVQGQKRVSSNDVWKELQKEYGI